MDKMVLLVSNDGNRLVPESTLKDGDKYLSKSYLVF
jgi:hypothetical protein